MLLEQIQNNVLEKKKGSNFCGTHMKGCPHGTIENSKQVDENAKVQVLYGLKILKELYIILMKTIMYTNRMIL